MTDLKRAKRLFKSVTLLNSDCCPTRFEAGFNKVKKNTIAALFVFLRHFTMASTKMQVFLELIVHPPRFELGTGRVYLRYKRFARISCKCLWAYLDSNQGPVVY